MLDFTDTEREKALEIIHDLKIKCGTALLPEDEEKLRRILFAAIDKGEIDRDIFGLNPLLMALQTAYIAVDEIGLGRDAIIATMLYPLYLQQQNSQSSDTFNSLSNREGWGESINRILHGLLKVQDLYKKTPSIESENFRNLLLSFAEDMRVILIMIADRVNMMREIRDVTNKEAQQRVAQEASYLYAPLAHKLGLYQLKSELEDLSLKYLEHDAYYHIKEKLSATKETRDKYITDFIGPIREKLEAAGLKFHMKGRTKSIHSIWQKMKKQKCPFEGVYDLFAIRIILDSPLDKEKMQCWQVYSIITDMYQPNPKRLRDWLSVPKSNGYESLHITVLGPPAQQGSLHTGGGGEPSANRKGQTREARPWVEVQIRTERMDDIAEHGLAAHWRYKGEKAQDGGIDSWLSAIRAALETSSPNNGEAGRGLMDQLRIDLVEDEVFVFTPKGEIKKYPAGATVLDFAYNIHSRVGNECVGARINGRAVKMGEVLHSGDTIEVLTSSQQKPKREWLNIVKTSHAKAKIKKAFAEMNRVEEEYKTHPQPLPLVGRGAANHDENVKKSASEFVLNEDVLINQSSGKNDRGHSDTIILPALLTGGAGGGSVDYTLAKCCKPIYGDNVFGFVTVSGGIKIHRCDCPNATALRTRFGYRIIKAKWNSSLSTGEGGGRGLYEVTLQVVGNDQLAIVNNITSVILKEDHVMLRGINIDSNDGLFRGTIRVSLDGNAGLASLTKKLRGIKGVKDVRRL